MAHYWIARLFSASHGSRRKSGAGYRVQPRMRVESLECRLTPAATTYVDDGFAGYSNGQAIADADSVTPGAQPATFGVDAFDTIAGAVANATGSTATVRVNPGNYALSQAILIDHTVRLLGPQAGVDSRPFGPGNARTANGGEAVITSSVDFVTQNGGAPDEVNGTNRSMLVKVTAGADGTVIDGFTLDGKGGVTGPNALTLLDGSTSNAGRGVDIDSDGVTVQNNRVLNTAYRGIQYGGTTDVAGGLATQNRLDAIGVQNASAADPGFAILSFGGTASATNNKATNCQVGIYYNQILTTTGAVSVTGNDLSVTRVGLTLNQTAAANTFTLTGNMVAVAGDSSPNALGVQFLTVANGAGVSFSGNAFTGPGTAGSKGAFLATAAAPALAITSSGNTFAGFETGLYVSNNEPDIGGLAGAAASLALPSGTVTAPAGGKGVYLLGDPAGPAVTLDLTGSTVAINGAGSGLVLSGSQAALAGNTLGSVAFAGTLTKYVTLTGAALAGTTVNGQSVSYGVVTGGVASAAQAFDIVDKIVDAVDAPGAGFVQLQAGDVFVTPNSFSTPATTTPDIQRAVNVLPAGGGTVLIKSGGYTGNVDTTAAGKAVTLSPGGPGVAATVNVAGNLTLDANDTLAADLNGPASYDQFVVTGNAALGSAALAVTLGYTPTAGDQFTLVSAGGSRTGTFSNASPIVVGGTKLYPVYDATTAKLTTNVPMNVYVDDNFTGPTGSTVTLPGGGTATIGYDAFPTVTAGQAAVAAAGTLTVFDGNYASENVTFLAGETVRLNVNPAANGGTGSTVVTLGSAAGSGTLDLNRLTFNTGATGASTQFAGQVTGVGTSALVKQGVGTFTLTNPNNDYRGGTAIAGGTLKTGASEVIPDQSLVTISGGGQLFLSGNAETVGGLAGTDPSATVALGTDGELYTGANNQSVSFAGTVNGAGSVVKVGTGTQTLGGANTHTGSAYFPAGTATAVYSGTLQLTNATPLAAGTRVDTTTGTLALAGPATFANEVYGSGSVAVNASTQLTNAANSYSGGTTVTAGTLTVTNDGQLGAAGGGVAATGAAVVSLGNGVTSGRAVTLQSGASLSVPSGTATLTGAVSGGILTGPGAVTASGATFTGVRIANTLDVTTAGGTTTFANTINQGTLTVVAGTTATLAAFTQSSGGRLMVLGTANVSGLTISGYTQVSGSGVLANTGSSDLTVSPGGILNVGYQEPLVGTASVVGGGTIDLGSRNIQLYGVVRNDGTLSTSSPASTRRVYVNSGGTYYTGSPPGTVGTGVAIAIRPGGVQRVGN